MTYFFDFHDGDKVRVDDVGVDLVDDIAARLQATIALTDIARDILPNGGNRRDLVIKVRNESGVLFEVSLDYLLLPVPLGPRA